MHNKAFRQIAAVGLMIALAFGSAAAGVESTETESVLGTAADPGSGTGLGFTESLEPLSSMPRPQQPDRGIAESRLDRGPALHFEPNQGQSHDDVEFLARADGYTFFLTDKEAVFVLAEGSAAPSDGSGEGPPFTMDLPEADLTGQSPDRVVRMQFEDALTPIAITGQGERQGKSNYLIGNDPDEWTANVPHFDEVVVEELWPGIDMVFLGQQGSVRFDFHVHPGADPDAIQLSFEGAAPSLDESGDLILESANGPLMRFPAPHTFQEPGERHIQVESGFLLYHKTTVGFGLGAYDEGELLIIDPVALGYSTYLGGDGDDVGRAIAVDDEGHAYITGHTQSNEFPTLDPIQGTNPGGMWSVFVTKLNPEGDGIVYSTYLGGSGSDNGRAITVDADGHAYITGYTGSSNFPTANAYQDNHPGGSWAAYVTKLNPEGNGLVYSTYLGGGNDEFGSGLALDSTGHVYVTGDTFSSDFPTHNAYDDTLPGGRSAFLTKLGPAGDSLVYSTYLGGDNDIDLGRDVTLDANDQAIVLGYTRATDFPTFSGYQNNYPGGARSVFLTKFNAAGDDLEFSTFLGGSGEELSHALVVADNSDVIVLGKTKSTDFPTMNAFQDTNPGGTWSGFVTRFHSTGESLVYSTYLGGSGDDRPRDLVVDDKGHAWVTGQTDSTDFPTRYGLENGYPGGPRSGFVAKLGVHGDTMAYSTYLGGSGDDRSRGLAVDPAGHVYVTGETLSIDFPTANAFQATIQGDGKKSAFVTKLANPLVCDAPGPDTYGYTCTVDGPFFNDISASGNPLSLGNNDESGPLDLTDGGLLDPFLYYGKAYKEVVVASDGHVILGDALSSDAFVGGYWTGLRPGDGGEVHWEIRSSDTDWFVVQFTDVPVGIGPQTATFQILLDMRNHEVFVAYGPVAGKEGHDAFSGTEALDGQGGLTYRQGVFHSPGDRVLNNGDGVYLTFDADGSETKVVQENDVRINSFDGNPAGDHVTSSDSDFAYGLVTDVPTALCFWDEDNTGTLKPEDPLYLATGRLACESVQEGDVRLDGTAGSNPGTIVTTNDQDLGRTLDPAGGTQLMYVDVEGTGQFDLGDPVKLKTGGTEPAVEVGDHRITSSPAGASFTRVVANDPDLQTALQVFPNDPHIDTPNVLSYYDNQKRTVIFEPPEPSAPSAPQNLIGATTPDPHVLLEWDLPEDNGMSHIQEYHIHRGPDAGSLDVYDTVLADGTSYTDTDVNPGETWVYAVLAKNDVGEGPLGNTLEVDVADVPGAPQNLGATAGPEVGEISLDWSEPEEDGAEPITDYRIYSGTTSGELTFLDTVPATQTEYTDTGLGPGETWYYEVKAENAVGEGDASNEDSATTFEVPGAPQNLVATAGPEVGEISLEWTEPEEDGGSPITDYWIYSGTTSGELTFLDTVPATQTEYTDTGLGPGETWFYEVKAENAVGEGDASNEDSATTFDMPTQPTAFDVTTGPGKGEITLSWQAPLDDGGQPVTEYRIYRGDSPDATTLIDEVDASMTSFTDTGLGDGVQRFYKVSAVNAVGEGGSTDTFGSTTQPADEPAQLPEGKSATSAAIQDGIAYVFGGRSEDGNATDAILRFHPETNNVTVTNATLLTPRLSTSAVWANISDNGEGPSGQGCHDLGCMAGNGFIFGGLETGFQEGLDGCHDLGCAALNEVLRFDPVQETVEKMEATFPEPVFMTSSVWDPLNEVAYIFGGAVEPHGPEGGPGTAGCHDLGCMRWVMIFNANEDSLTPHDAELPVGLAGTSAVWDPVQSVAYIFGGTNEDGDGEDRIFKFDPSSTEVDVLPATLPGDRWNTSAVFDGQHAYIMGGENETGMVDEIVRFNPLTDAVEVVGFLPKNRTQTSAVFDDKDVYIIGGLEEDGESTNEIVKFTPTAPQQAQAQPGPGVGQNNVSWSPPLDDGGEPVEAYRVYRVEGGGLQRIAVVPVETTHYVDDGLENGTTYQYRVSAVNNVGEGPQSPLTSATTFEVPGAPQSIDATPGPAFGEITLEWDAPEDDGRTPVTQYKVYRADENEGPFQLLESVPWTNQSFTDTGLGELETFNYRVHAVNLVGEGSASESVEALTYDPMNLYVREGGLTLENALKFVAPGGTIHIAPGTYEQEVLVDKNITIQQGVADGPVPEDAQGAPVVIGSIQVHDVTDFTIKDLHLQATPGGQRAGTVFEAQGALRLDVHNVTFIGDGTPKGAGFYPGLVDVQAVQQFTFTGNLIDADPATAGGVSGLRVQSVTQTNVTLRLENNTFRHANGAGVTVQGDNPQAMVLLQDNMFTANHDGLVLFETVFETIRAEDNQWTNNTAKGVRYVGAVQGESVYRYNQFTGNDIGFAVNTLSDPVDARFNWWGSPAGPLAGDQANMLLVDYTPWCLQEDCSLIGGLEEGLGLPLKDDEPGLPLKDEPAADVTAPIRS